VDPSATPWRVLEDPANETPTGVDAAGAGSDGAVRLPRSAIVTGGIAVVLAIGAFVLAFGSGSGGSVAVEGGVPLDSGQPGASSSADRPGAVGDGRIVVEIVGAVERPGVFRLPADSRVGDLVAAAGGYGPRVDADRAGRELNLAATLKDGDQVRVPSRDDAAARSPRPVDGGGQGGGGQGGGGQGGGGGPAAEPIDLNKATESELDTLPGIGPVTAAKIVASREEQPFAAIEDLRTRKLVGEKTFASLKDLVTVS
jgi:competence protein ComEA